VSAASETARTFARDAAHKAQDGRHRLVIAKAIGSYDRQVARAKGAVVDFAAGRAHLAARRDEALAHLPDLLERFEREAAARGTHVHWAETAEDACRIVLDVCRRHGARRVVKSKSMVTEEIALNEALAAEGIEPLETDLGEYIVQLRGEPPYHIVTPAMHLSKDDIDATFHEKLGSAPGRSAEELTAIARARLRDAFLGAPVGISGANFLVAETGMISITENEGNARLATSLPRVHVAITGIEKVIATLDDLAVFLPMLAASGTGQTLTCYGSQIAGPRAAGEPDGPDEMHVILLDNGRTRLYADGERREALRCIRCGACLNACPVYRAVGGHAYGTTYQGPIGSVITPHLRGDPFTHLPFASSLCGACTDVCPVGIDLHHHLLENRRDAVAAGAAAGGGALTALAFALWGLVMTRPWLYRLSVRAARLGQALLGALGLAGTRLDPTRRWSASRALPAMPRETFRDWWNERGGPP